MSTAPRIKTTVVGSYPVPDWLAALPSEQALVDATRVVIATQEEAGIDLVCDGELYRFDMNHPETNGMIEYFVRPLDGVRTRMSFEELFAYRGRKDGVPRAAAGRRRGTDRRGHARRCRTPARARSGSRRAPSSSRSPGRTCWRRRSSTGTTSRPPTSRSRSPTCSPRR